MIADFESSSTPPLSSHRIAQITGATWTATPSSPLRGVAPLEEAGADELGFLANRRYLDAVEGSRAGALLVDAELADEVAAAGRPCLVAENAHEALLRLLRELHPEKSRDPGIHPTAVLGRGVELGEDVHVGPYAVLEDGVRVGDRCRIGAHAVLGEGARVGNDSVLHPHVVVYPAVGIGDRVVLHAGVRLGVDGFGYVLQEGSHEKVPQVGPCEVGDDVEVGANSCVDRGSIGRTSVGAGAKLDNLVHLGHNVKVGEKALVVAQVGIAGSSRIGPGAVLGGQAGIGGHLTVGEGARVAGQAGVIGDVPPGATISGYPARDHRAYLRGMANVFRLPALIRRVRDLEERLAELDGDEPEAAERMGDSRDV